MAYSTPYLHQNAATSNSGGGSGGGSVSGSGVNTSEFKFSSSGRDFRRLSLFDPSRIDSSGVTPNTMAVSGQTSAAQQQQQQQLRPTSSSTFGLQQASASQLWMGDIEPWMDEECVRLIWARMGEHVAVKMIRDRLTGGPANYCFVEVASPAEAERLLATHNGAPMPLPFLRAFRLNRAAGAVMPNNISSTSSSNAMALTTNHVSDTSEFSLFVGDLAPEVSDVLLASEFRSRYASVRTAKVVVDPVTAVPRGYGFVRFADEHEHQRALVEMQGWLIGSRPVRVSAATPKRGTGATVEPVRDGAGSPTSSASSDGSNESYNPATDPYNTTVFVGGLMGPVGEHELHNFFATHGEVVYCKIPPNRGCGFVTFAKRACAEAAMRALNGHLLGGSRVRLSWGRSQSHARHNHHRRHQLQHRGSISGADAAPVRRSASIGKHSTPQLGLGLTSADAGAVQRPLQLCMPALAANAPPPALVGHHPPPPHLAHLPPMAAYQPAPETYAPQGYYNASPMHAGALEFYATPTTPHAHQQHCYYEPSMLSTPVAGPVDSPLYFSSSQHTLGPAHARTASAQLDELAFARPQILGEDHHLAPRYESHRLSAPGMLMPSPGELLSRRLSVLALSNHRSSTNSPEAAKPPPPIERRPSVGVIGQRRLSVRPALQHSQSLIFTSSNSDKQQPPVGFSASALWSSVTGNSSAYSPTLNPQPGDAAAKSAALSTPVSSTRSSTSSLSLLAVKPHAVTAVDSAIGFSDNTEHASLTGSFRIV